MRSHSYAFSVAECTKTAAAPIVGAAILAAALHGAHWFGMLPPSRPNANTDQTVMAFKWQLSCSRRPAPVILVGDSSCATGIDAPKLRDLLPGHPAVLNLGLYIGFGLDVYGEVLEEHLKHNPGEVRLVVLLVTPQFLADQSVAANAQELWSQVRRGEHNVADSNCSLWSRLLGMGLLKERMLRRVLHVPIPGGGFYGFTSGLADYLACHEGSMVDLGTFHPPAHPILDRYFLSPTMERASREFRRRLPPGVKLAIGITPVPESVCSADYPRTRDELLMAWNRWIDADYVLTNAPAKLPDSFFGTRTHPNQLGQERLTRQLGLFLIRHGAIRAFAFPSGPGRTS